MVMMSQSFVIPAKAGTQPATVVAPLWVPAFAGMTTEEAF